VLEVWEACSQGGVLLPLLWNMAIDGLLRRLRDEGIWIQGFTNEVEISINGKFLNTV
jgi:hypothetical protein